MKHVKVEICCGCIDDVLLAGRYNIDRIELNSALELGGLTPTLTTLKVAKKHVKQPIVCMVRPRGAGFMYSEIEIENMFLEAKELLDAGADGIVFGFLNKDHTIDKDNTKKMCDLIHSYGKEAIFHKAFDECYDLEKAIVDCIECKVERILTGGGKCSIERGSQVVGQLFEKYGEKIELLPGGGVTPANILDIVENTKSGQIHMTAKKTFYDDGEYVAVDEETLKKALSALKK